MLVWKDLRRNYSKRMPGLEAWSKIITSSKQGFENSKMRWLVCANPKLSYSKISDFSNYRMDELISLSKEILQKDSIAKLPKPEVDRNN